MKIDANIALAGIVANVIAGSNNVNDAARPARRTAALVAVQPPIETPRRCTPVKTEPGQGLVQPLRLIVGTGEGLVLHGQARLAEQVDAVDRALLEQRWQVHRVHRRRGVAAGK